MKNMKVLKLFCLLTISGILSLSRFYWQEYQIHSIILPTETVVIPLDLDSVGRPVVQVTMGNQLCKFLLDTGNTNNVTIRSSRIINSSIYKRIIHKVCPLRTDVGIGLALFVDVSCEVRLDEIYGFRDGAIGLGLFKNSGFRIDFPNKKLLIGQKLDNDSNDMSELKIDLRAHRLIIPVIFGDGTTKVKIDFICDTGFNGGLKVPKGTELPFNNKYIGFLTSESPSEISRCDLLKINATAFLGNHQYSDPEVIVGGDYYLIGTAILKDFILSVDQKNDEFALICNNN